MKFLSQILICEGEDIYEIFTETFFAFKIFYDISLTDNISIGVISTGLYQKMITSATGLTIGLTAFIAYYILNSILDSVINNMEEASTEFVDMLQEQSK